MMMLMKFNIAILWSLCFLSLICSQQVYAQDDTPASNETCKELETQADGTIRKILLIGEKNPVIPRNVSQLNEHCRMAKQALPLASKYGKCLDHFPKQVLNIVLRNVKKVAKKICTEKRNGKSGGSFINRKATLKHLRCLTKDNIGDFYSILSDGIRRIDYISEKVEVTQMIPYLCCAYHIIYRDLLAKVKQHCITEGGSVGSAELIGRLANAVAGEVLDLACNKFSNVQDCEEKIPEGTRNLINTRGNDTVLMSNRFLISSVINIATRLST